MFATPRSLGASARLAQSMLAGPHRKHLQMAARMAPRAIGAGVAVRALPMGARFATVTSDGSDPDFAPKKAEKAAKAGRDVAAEIKEMVTTRKAMLFMKGTPDFPMCGFSNRAVQMLDQLQASYGAFNVLEDTEVREGVKKFSNWPTIPQLYVKGEFIGGCDIMMELNASGELKKLLAEAGALSAK